ncbi:hypothetical protein VULLAG_LOCUS18125 [Vulpes lagopus]
MVNPVVDVPPGPGTTAVWHVGFSNSFQSQNLLFKGVTTSHVFQYCRMFPAEQNHPQVELPMRECASISWLLLPDNPGQASVTGHAWACLGFSCPRLHVTG